MQRLESNSAISPGKSVVLQELLEKMVENGLVAVNTN